MSPTLSSGSETLPQLRCHFGSRSKSNWAGIQPTHPPRTKLFDRVELHGQPAELHRQSRVLIHSHRRGSAGMEGKGDVFGLCDYLAVWDHDRFNASLDREAYTDEDARAV